MPDHQEKTASAKLQSSSSRPTARRAIHCGDALHVLKSLDTESVDLVCTDPPYGIGFMGRSWDKSLPQKGVFEECLRVLKPGAFAFVMCAPRSDVCSRMMLTLEDAGFSIGFTPIYWTYASGFPKAANMGKKADKRVGAQSLVVSTEEFTGSAKSLKGSPNRKDWRDQGPGGTRTPIYERKVGTSEAGKRLQGSYAGFQPKPAVEVVIVAMKPLSEKSYVDQALKNGKGVTWLDSVRIPTTEEMKVGFKDSTTVEGWGSFNKGGQRGQKKAGRFPANLIVSDYALGPHSRFFSLDAVALESFPFLVVPKASKREKNMGLAGFEEQERAGLPLRAVSGKRNGIGGDGTKTDRVTTTRNGHPTVKPLRLMQYLITLGSRPGDLVLDPFLGSGTTAMAAESLGRRIIGIEREREYVEIAQARTEWMRRRRLGQ